MGAQPAAAGTACRVQFKVDWALGRGCVVQQGTLCSRSMMITEPTCTAMLGCKCDTTDIVYPKNSSARDDKTDGSGAGGTTVSVRMMRYRRKPRAVVLLWPYLPQQKTVITICGIWCTTQPTFRTSSTGGSVPLFACTSSCS